MGRGALVLLALLTACTEAPGPAPAPTPTGAPIAPPPATAPPAPQHPAQPAGDLFGEWQVAGFRSDRLTPQQQRMGDPSAVAVLIGARTIEAASQCMPYLFDHRRSERRIVVTARAWPEPVCARMPLPFEAAFGGVMEGATSVHATPSGGVLLSGGAGAVALARPAAGRIDNPFGNAPAPGPRLLWGHFRVEEVGGIRVPPGQPIDVAIGRFWIEARSGCLPFRWKMVRADATLAIAREPWPDPVCEQGLTEAEQALDRILPTVRRLEWTAPYRLRLIGPGGSVTLSRVKAGA